MLIIIAISAFNLLSFVVWAATQLGNFFRLRWEKLGVPPRGAGVWSGAIIICSNMEQKKASALQSRNLQAHTDYAPPCNQLPSSLFVLPGIQAELSA